MIRPMRVIASLLHNVQSDLQKLSVLSLGDPGAATQGKRRGPAQAQERKER